MTSRKSSEKSDSISLFPFLAVLLCTMGALLVLLVILVQRAAERALLPDASKELAVDEGPRPQAPVVNNAAEEESRLREELAKVARYRAQLDELHAEGQRRLVNERLRLSHLEEHTRRLEEELAKLSIAAEQLKQTEENQTVDQAQAEKELARLEQLVIDTEKQIEAMREDNAGGKKSYAIVPYKGPNGTYRKPIYIECTADGVTIHPEGLKLTETDFIATAWPGNPLASILRASREYLNEKAAREGAPEPPDPYPLILVRPDGIDNYSRARSAITSWDSDYGYELIDGDMKLAFPDAVDPQLARVQHHALMISRDRLVQLVQAAPSRFRGVRLGDGTGGGDGLGGHGGYGGGGDFGGAGGEGIAGTFAGDGSATGAGGAVGVVGGSGEHPDGRGDNPPGSLNGDAQYGNLNAAGGQPGANAGDPTGGADGSESGTNSGEGPSLVGPRYAQQGGTAGQQGVPTNAPSEPLDKSQTGGTPGGPQMAGGGAGSAAGAQQGSGGGGSPGMSFGGSQPTESIADSKGSNWAIDRGHIKSVAIRRPIPVMVRDNKMVLSANRNMRRGAEATPHEISLDQPINEISHQFQSAIRDRIEDWGIAGSGMYWRPVLELNVEPNAQMTATRIVHLLKDSGVEVQLPASADASAGQGGALR